jgi:hypothetical protein
MDRILAFFAIELALLVTPMIWPTIPFEIGMSIYGVAIVMAIFALFFWWREKVANPMGQKLLSASEPSAMDQKFVSSLFLKLDNFSNTLKKKTKPNVEELMVELRDSFNPIWVDAELSEARTQLIHEFQGYLSDGASVTVLSNDGKLVRQMVTTRDPLPDFDPGIKTGRSQI